MKQYVITAHDFTDADALQRRIKMRPAHLEGVKILKANNNYVVGGALLNEAEQMVGSVMIVQFETDELMKNWMSNDPYVTGKVWDKIDVKLFRQAVV